MTTTRIIVAAIVVAVAACQPAGSPIDRLREGIAGDATCAELFRIRNDIEPGHDDVDRANQLLRGVGCFSSTSNRTDR